MAFSASSLGRVHRVKPMSMSRRGMFGTNRFISGPSFEQILANGNALVPQPRILAPQEIAHLTVWLGSAQSDGMAGRSVLLDGRMLMTRACSTGAACRRLVDPPPSGAHMTRSRGVARRL